MRDLTDKYLGDLQTRYRASPLPAFFRWWGDELREVVPVQFRRRMVAPRPRLIIEPLADGSLKLFRSGEDGLEDLATFSEDDELSEMRARVLEILGSFDDGAPEIRLCLEPEQVLECKVTLPQAVERNLAQALSYQFDQITPFKAEQVYYDYRVDDRNRDTGTIALTVRLVLKEAVDSQLERLARLGIKPHAVDILDGDEAPEPAGYNLLPEAQRPRYVHRRARINIVLAVASVALLALVMAQSIYLRGQTIDELQEEADRLRGEAREVAELRQELEDSLIAANFLAERRREHPVVIEVLAEVTDLIPDEIWLQRFTISDNQLQIQGLADGSQQLIELLNDSALLDDAEFRGSVSVDSVTGKERFTTHARIQGRGDRADADSTGS